MKPCTRPSLDGSQSAQFYIISQRVENHGHLLLSAVLGTLLSLYGGLRMSLSAIGPCTGTSLPNVSLWVPQMYNSAQLYANIPAVVKFSAFLCLVSTDICLHRAGEFPENFSTRFGPPIRNCFFFFFFFCLHRTGQFLENFPTGVLSSSRVGHPDF